MANLLVTPPEIDPGHEVILPRRDEELHLGGEDLVDARKYAEIRYMTAKDAMAELRRLANGASLDLPPRMNTKLEAPEF